MRLSKIASLSLSVLLLSFVSPEPQAFSNKVLSTVRSSIEFSSEMPQKEEMFELLNQIGAQGAVLETGSDDLRIKYVNAQGCIEHALACFQALGEIDQLIGVIHTPTPATPLCVRPDGYVDDILDASIRDNPMKLLTVRSRAQIVREYLIKGGKLYVAYPKGGLEKRSTEQQAVYREALARFPEQLVDWVLDADKIDPDVIGATYLFRNDKGQLFAFSIKSRQVNDIQSQTEWGIWFGPLEGKVAERVGFVFDSLKEVGGPDPRRELRETIDLVARS